jgi:hypothetical protein
MVFLCYYCFVELNKKMNLQTINLLLNSQDVNPQYDRDLMELTASELGGTTSKNGVISLTSENAADFYEKFPFKAFSSATVDPNRVRLLRPR